MLVTTLALFSFSSVQPPVADAPTGASSNVEVLEQGPTASHKRTFHPIAEVSAPEFDRVGATLNFGGGFSYCFQPLCGLVPVTLGGSFELGYRKNKIAFGAAVAYAGFRSNEPIEGETIDGHFGFLTVGPQLFFFPLSEGRFDPYIGALLGVNWTRFVVRASDQFLESRYRIRRPSARIALGFNIYTNEHFSVGPRYEQTFGIAGQECQFIDTVGDDCQLVSDIIDSQGDVVQQRTFRITYPKQQSLMLQLHTTF